MQFTQQTLQGVFPLLVPSLPGFPLFCNECYIVTLFYVTFSLGYFFHTSNLHNKLSRKCSLWSFLPCQDFLFFCNERVCHMQLLSIHLYMPTNCINNQRYIVSFRAYLAYICHWHPFTGTLGTLFGV